MYFEFGNEKYDVSRLIVSLQTRISDNIIAITYKINAFFSQIYCLFALPILLITGCNERTAPNIL
jgi:hypothetical protein